MGVTTTYSAVPSPTAVPNTRWLRSSSTYRPTVCVSRRTLRPNTQERCCDASLGNLQQAAFHSTATHARSAAVHALPHGMHQKAPTGDPQSSATCERPGSQPVADVGGSTGPGPSEQEACRCEDGSEGPHSSHRPASMRWKNLASAATSLIPRPLQLRLPLRSSATPATDIATAKNSSSRNSSNSGCDSAELTLNSRVRALGVLAACYVHCAAVTCSVPVLMPAISESLRLTGEQGSCAVLCCAMWCCAMQCCAGIERGAVCRRDAGPVSTITAVLHQHASLLPPCVPPHRPAVCHADIRPCVPVRPSAHPHGHAQRPCESSPRAAGGRRHCMERHGGHGVARIQFW